jgi:thiosulfate dehydrogenase [quinone] large subunit
MVGAFSKSMLPRALVLPFSYILPVAEFIIGILCITGLFTAPALVAGGLEMSFLIFGSCLIENWEPIVSQLVHALVFVILLQCIAGNSWALDNLFQ